MGKAQQVVITIGHISLLLPDDTGVATVLKTLSKGIPVLHYPGAPVTNEDGSIVQPKSKEKRARPLELKQPAALQMMTALQASLIAKRTQAGDALKHLRTASRLGEFRHITAPLPDRQMLAANDPPEGAEEAPLPAHHHRTLSVHDLMQLELRS
jgi:hypothetical protein